MKKSELRMIVNQMVEEKVSEIFNTLLSVLNQNNQSESTTKKYPSREAKLLDEVNKYQKLKNQEMMKQNKMKKIRVTVETKKEPKNDTVEKFRQNIMKGIHLMNEAEAYERKRESAEAKTQQYNINELKEEFYDPELPYDLDNPVLMNRVMSFLNKNKK